MTYRGVMEALGVLLALTNGVFLALFTPPTKQLGKRFGSWWVATSLRLLTSALMLTGVFIAVVYSPLPKHHLQAVRTCLAVLVVYMLVASGFHLTSLLKYREWGAPLWWRRKWKKFMP